MKITVLLFAQCRQAAGRDALELDIPEGGGTGALWPAIAGACPALLPFRATARVAVNHSFATGDAPLRPGDEVALIPPVSGG